MSRAALSVLVIRGYLVPHETLSQSAKIRFLTEHTKSRDFNPNISLTEALPLERKFNTR